MPKNTATMTTSISKAVADLQGPFYYSKELTAVAILIKVTIFFALNIFPSFKWITNDLECYVTIHQLTLLSFEATGVTITSA